MINLIFIVSILLTCFYQSMYSTSYAASKRTPPSIDNKDILLSLEQENNLQSTNIDKFHMYSTISMLPNNHQISFHILKSEIDNIISLITLNLHHDFQTYLLFEYMDYSIWGVLGNYQNRDIEQIEFENRIMKAIKDLETVNKRFRHLANKEKLESLEFGQLVTLDPSNYIVTAFNEGVIIHDEMEHLTRIQNNSHADYRIGSVFNTPNSAQGTGSEEGRPGSTKIKNKIFLIVQTIIYYATKYRVEIFIFVLSLMMLLSLKRKSFKS